MIYTEYVNIFHFFGLPLIITDISSYKSSKIKGYKDIIQKANFEKSCKQMVTYENFCIVKSFLFDINGVVKILPLVVVARHASYH